MSQPWESTQDAGRPSLTATGDQLKEQYAKGMRGFAQGKLAGIDLSYIQLSDANFFGADLHNANLCGADLRRANLGQANLSGAILDGANLSDAYLTDANLNNADFRDVVRDRPSLAPATALVPQPPSALSAAPASPTTRFCMYCGAMLPAQATFCVTCGRAQATVPDVQTPAPLSSPWPNADSSPATPLTNAVSDPSGLGSPLRFVWTGLGGALAAFGILASLVPVSFAGLLFWSAIGRAAFRAWVRHHTR
jgi:hypothetical protein